MNIDEYIQKVESSILSSKNKLKDNTLYDITVYQSLDELNESILDLSNAIEQLKNHQSKKRKLSS